MTRSFRGNISFPSFPTLDFEVGSRKTTKPKILPKRKTGPNTSQQTKSATSDNNTRTRVSNQSTSHKSRVDQLQKKHNICAGYLAGDESKIIQSDTSNITDWEWIVGGFPCRDMIKERNISDNCIKQWPPKPS